MLAQQGEVLLVHGCAQKDVGPHAGTFCVKAEGHCGCAVGAVSFLGLRLRHE